MFLRFIVLIALICYSGVSCYCIYNESDDANFDVRQLVENTSASIFTRFKRELLGKGQSGCCPYTEKDCVFNRKKDTVVFLNIQKTINGREFPSFVISVPGGGWVVFGGYGIEHSLMYVFNSDGTPHNYEYRSGVEGIF